MELPSRGRNLDRRTIYELSGRYAEVQNGSGDHNREVSILSLSFRLNSWCKTLHIMEMISSKAFGTGPLFEAKDQ